MIKKSYRSAVGIVLIKPQKGIFAGKRIGKFSHSWQMPQGGIDANEIELDAAKRELFEETSVRSTKLLNQIHEWLAYDIPQEYIPSFWNGKYQGQKQKWFLMEFIGEDDEINVMTDEAEFSDWNWLSAEEILENIVPFKKNLYLEVFKSFGLLS